MSLPDQASSIAAMLPHPNLFVKPLPFGCDERVLREHFGAYGELTSVRVCAAGSSASQSGAPVTTSHAFVRFTNIRSAYLALQDQPRSSMVLGQPVIVKLADSDMTPKLQSGQCESEWVYIRGLPPAFPDDEVVKIFSKFGSILDMKYFGSTAHYKGTGALVRYGDVEHARQAIETMNEKSFPGCVQPLIVRFADSPAEKAAKMNRKELKAKSQLQTALQTETALNLALMQLHAKNAMQAMKPVVPPLHQPIMKTPYLQPAIPTQSAVSNNNNDIGSLVDSVLPRKWALTVGGIPRDLGNVTNVKLWLYETFACFGAILSVNVFQDSMSLGSDMSMDSWYQADATIYFAGLDSAVAAKEALHGSEHLGQRLHVSFAWEGASKSHANHAHQSLTPSSLMSPYSSGFSDTVLENLQNLAV